jgi:hypothetical protein
MRAWHKVSKPLEFVWENQSRIGSNNEAACHSHVRNCSDEVGSIHLLLYISSWNCRVKWTFGNLDVLKPGHYVPGSRRFVTGHFVPGPFVGVPQCRLSVRTIPS